MRSKITVFGADEHLTANLGEGDWADVVSPGDIAGSHIVVVGGGDAAQAGRLVARRASGAVVLVAAEDPQAGVRAVLAASLLPRGRVVGVRPDQVRSAAEAIVLGRDTPLEAAALVRGELGIEDDVSMVPLVVGRGGIRRIGD